MKHCLPDHKPLISNPIVLLILTICLLTSFSASAQFSRKDYRKFDKIDYFKTASPNNSRYGIVNSGTFNKIVKKDLQFIILGEDSPIAGFSLDVSDKTKAKISGRLPTKKGIHTLELEGGQKDSDISLFEKGKYNGQLELKYNWHYIPFKSAYRYQNKAHAAVDPLFKIRINELNEQMIDSAKVLAYFLHHYDQDIFEVLTKKPRTKIEEADTGITNQYPVNPDGAPAIQITASDVLDPSNLSAVSLNQELYVSLAKKYFPEVAVSAHPSEPNITAIIVPGAVCKIDVLSKDFKHLLARLARRKELTNDAEMAIADPFWGRKRLFWFTFSPSVNYQAYNIYGKDENGVMLKAKSTEPFFTPKLAAWISSYTVYEQAGLLFRFGAELVYGNNLKEFTEVKYYVRDTLQAEGNGNVVIEEEVVTGIFRKPESSKKSKLYTNIHAEYYILPKKTFIPGFNVKLSYMREGILSTTPYRLRLQGGFVFTLLNKEKDKPLLSILPYARYDNLLDETVKEGDVERYRTGRDKLSIGIVLGLPIKGLLFIKEE